MQFTLKATGTGVLTTLQINIALMVWSGNGSAGDSLVVVDNNGKDIWRAVAPAAANDLSLSFGEHPVAHNGINVTTISSGTFTVYYR